MMKYLKYYIVLFPMSSVLVGIFLGGHWLWLGLAVLFVVVIVGGGCHLVDKKCWTPIRKLGEFTFLEGQYVYIGRAGKNLTQRISSHKRLHKKRFWHTDYRLSNKHVRVFDISCEP